MAQYGVALLIDPRPNSLHLYPEILCRVVQADLAEIIYSEISRETSSLYAGLDIFCLFEARPQMFTLLGREVARRMHKTLASSD